MSEIEKKIGYIFKNPKLLDEALTHSSLSPSYNYQRLEFLGDRVLGLCVASLLYEKFPSEPEGSLSQRHTALVCKECVAEVVSSLGLDKFIKLANEENRLNENMLCDIGEALIGAIFMDSGYNDAFKFVQNNWQKLVEKNLSPPKDSKTALQEIAHIKGFNAPVYEIVKKEGSEHQPVFLVEVSIEDIGEQQGKGRTKKLAEQDAAAKMLKILG